MYVPSRSMLIRIAGFFGLYGAFFYYQGYINSSPADPLPGITDITSPIFERHDVISQYRKFDKSTGPGVLPDSASTPDDSSSNVTYSQQERESLSPSYNMPQSVSGVQRDGPEDSAQQDSDSLVNNAFFSQSAPIVQNGVSSSDGVTVGDTRQNQAETPRTQPLTLEQQYALESRSRTQPGCPSFLTPSMINEYNYLTLQAMGCSPTFTY